jgi:high affinity cGMP-specific 3',5'-cyclic phosphodiesterase 9
MIQSNIHSFYRKSPELVSSYIQIPEDVNTFEFDACFIDECFVLKNIAGYIFKKILKKIQFDYDEISLTNFISCLCEKYNKNYFHNFQHAVNVLQITYMLLIETDIINKLKPHIIFATLISAISHDVDHPGNTNSYEINSQSKYAKIYNDISVLENHHCCLTFELLESNNILKFIKNEDFKEFRKTIIQCILGTDMSKHNDCLQRFSELNENALSYSIDEQILISSCFIHFSDLSNSIKTFELSYEWSKRISHEFYEQTIKEEIEHLPSLSFMRANDKLSICINEINFIQNISIPTWKLFVSKFKKMGFLLEKNNAILLRWKELEKQYISEKDINNLNY